MFEAGLSVTFRASHSLRGNFGAAQQLHEHDYRVDLSVISHVLTDDGIVMDIVVLENSVRRLLDQWNGQCLDRRPELEGINTTVEMLSRFIHERVSAVLPQHNDLILDVKVWESPLVWGAYRGPGQSPRRAKKQRTGGLRSD
jgi:6-pyruvoyltetrahydropterin/6-carboxytetrahydropterin synthase